MEVIRSAIERGEGESVVSGLGVGYFLLAVGTAIAVLDLLASSPTRGLGLVVACLLTSGVTLVLAAAIGSRPREEDS